MKTDELIKIAHRCFDRTSKCGDCPLHKEPDCTVMLINELADKIEKAMADLEYSKSCYTCLHNGKSYKEPPCSLCTPLEFNKWQWKGDAE